MSIVNNIKKIYTPNFNKKVLNILNKNEKYLYDQKHPNKIIEVSKKTANFGVGLSENIFNGFTGVLNKTSNLIKDTYNAINSDAQTYKYYIKGKEKDNINNIRTNINHLELDVNYKGNQLIDAHKTNSSKFFNYISSTYHNLEKNINKRDKQYRENHSVFAKKFSNTIKELDDILGFTDIDDDIGNVLSKTKSVSSRAWNKIKPQVNNIKDNVIETEKVAAIPMQKMYTIGKNVINNIRNLHNNVANGTKKILRKNKKQSTDPTTTTTKSDITNDTTESKTNTDKIISGSPVNEKISGEDKSFYDQVYNLISGGTETTNKYIAKRGAKKVQNLQAKLDFAYEQKKKKPDFNIDEELAKIKEEFGTTDINELKQSIFKQAKEGPQTTDYVYAYAPKAAGYGTALGLGAIVLDAATNRGRMSNEQLYGNPF